MVALSLKTFAIDEKKLVWIHGTTARWNGYLHFQREPEQMLEGFDTYMR